MLERIPLERAALFLDLDGTLAPIAARPEDVGPDRGRNVLLRRLNEALEGRLAVVSGRSIADVDRILDGSVMCVAGVHGLERRESTGQVTSMPPHPALGFVRAELEDFVKAWPGARVEFKTLAVAVHYRLAGGAEGGVVEIAARLAASTGLILQRGNMVAELRSPGADKGVSVRAYMSGLPFAPAIPIFIGDDLTDEHGFSEAERLNGVGILVGPARATNASARLADVETVAAWLADALETGFFMIER